MPDTEMTRKLTNLADCHALPSELEVTERPLPRLPVLDIVTQTLENLDIPTIYPGHARWKYAGETLPVPQFLLTYGDGQTASTNTLPTLYF